MENTMTFNSLREKISFESQLRKERNAGFQFLVSVAHEKGIQAGRDCVPIPMVVCTSTGKPIEQLDSGACGFAWIVFSGNTAFGRWAKKQGIARPHYPKGLCVWVSDFGQSVDRKAAYAGAYAQVLRNAGIDCYADSRLD
jgi:hypothetical protein